MTREQAVQTEGMWAGFVRTDPGMVSGWHHHGRYESSIYVLSGSLRMEFGRGGEESFDAGPGDFVFVGKQLVHRESNPSTEPAAIVVVRAGEGETGRQRRRPRVGDPPRRRPLVYSPRVTVLGGELAVPCTRDPLQRG
jgi:uncharacterized RmlC-like cupin family protein